MDNFPRWLWRGVCYDLSVGDSHKRNSTNVEQKTKRPVGRPRGSKAKAARPAMGTVSDLIEARKRAHRREAIVARAVLITIFALAVWLAR